MTSLWLALGFNETNCIHVWIIFLNFPYSSLSSFGFFHHWWRSLPTEYQTITQHICARFFLVLAAAKFNWHMILCIRRNTKLHHWTVHFNCDANQISLTNIHRRPERTLLWGNKLGSFACAWCRSHASEIKRNHLYVISNFTFVFLFYFRRLCDVTIFFFLCAQQMSTLFRKLCIYE